MKEPFQEWAHLDKQATPNNEHLTHHRHWIHLSHRANQPNKRPHPSFRSQESSIHPPSTPPPFVHMPNVTWIDTSCCTAIVAVVLWLFLGLSLRRSRLRRNRVVGSKCRRRGWMESLACRGECLDGRWRRRLRVTWQVYLHTDPSETAWPFACALAASVGWCTCCRVKAIGSKMIPNYIICGGAVGLIRSRGKLQRRRWSVGSSRFSDRSCWWNYLLSIITL